MKKVLVVGFYGWGNCGDESILGGIVNTIGSIDPSVDIEVATDIPFTIHKCYNGLIKLNIRTLSDFNLTGVDLIILGGGGLSFGYGYGIIFNAFRLGIPVVYLGISINRAVIQSEGFLYVARKFSDITVRSKPLSDLFSSLDIKHTLSFCPSIQSSIEDMPLPPYPYILVTPRLYGDDEEQVDWIVSSLSRIEGPIYLVPFSSMDLQGNPIDLGLCHEIQERMKPRALTIDWSGYKYQRIRALFRGASLIINGGRYHSAVYAMEFGIPMTAYMKIPTDEYLTDHYKIYDLLSEFQSTATQAWDNDIRKKILLREKENKTVLEKYLW